MTNAPKSLEWHGETIWLRGAKELPASDGKIYTRYECGIESETKAYFYDFGNGVDWESEQSGNQTAPSPDAPIVLRIKERRELKKSEDLKAYNRDAQRRYRARQAAKPKHRLEETPPEAKPNYDEFREWIEKGMK